MDANISKQLRITSLERITSLDPDNTQKKQSKKFNMRNNCQLQIKNKEILDRINQISKDKQTTLIFFNDFDFLHSQFKAIDLLQLANSKISMTTSHKAIPPSNEQKKQTPIWKNRLITKSKTTPNISFDNFKEEIPSEVDNENIELQTQSVSKCALLCKNYNAMQKAIREYYKQRATKKLKANQQEQAKMNFQLLIEKLGKEHQTNQSSKNQSMKQQKKNLCQICSLVYNISLESARLALRNLPELFKYGQFQSLLNSPARQYIEKAQQRLLTLASEQNQKKLVFKQRNKTLSLNEQKQYNILTEFEQHQGNKRIFEDACKQIKTVQLKKHFAEKQKPIKEIFSQLPFYKQNHNLQKNIKKKYATLVKQYDINVLGIKQRAATTTNSAASKILFSKQSPCSVFSQNKAPSFADSLQFKNQRQLNLQIQSKFTNFLNDIIHEQNPKKTKIKQFHGFAMLAKRLRLRNPSRKIDNNIKTDILQEQAKGIVISRFTNKLAKDGCVK